MRVYKLGGPALEDPALLPPLAHELNSSPEPAVVVHGGGRHVERLLRELHIESRFVDGRRETSPAAMDVVEMVLSGVVNKSIVAGLGMARVRAIGVSGRDAALLTATPEPGLGRVGLPARVDARVLHALLDAGFTPVVSPVSTGPSGESLNVNADEVALAVAQALGAHRLVFFTDVDGVRVDGEPVDRLDAARIDALVADGTITAGMAMKVGAALQAARAGVPEVWVAGKARLLGGFAGTRITVGGEVPA
jgi:acetylglutamate kinase